jgi:ATP-dependent helicase/DNAse subunit B
MDTLFEKNFKISGLRTYKLPHPESMFKESPWQLDNLQTLKNNLNEVKSRLNNYNLQEWHQHTSHMNEASDIVNCVKKHTRAELVTQAWCKFYEIASQFFINSFLGNFYSHDPFREIRVIRDGTFFF